MKPINALFLALAASIACVAIASPDQTAAVRAGLAKILPAGSSIESIRPSPLPALREVVVDGRVVYVTVDGKYLLQGALLDLDTRTNLTEASEAAIHRAVLAKIGPEQRIIFAAAKPKHRVTVFTDIDCGYCRKMHEQIAEYNNAGITVEYLFYPRAGLNSEAYTASVNVWCAPDRRKALTSAKQGLAIPKRTCTNPVATDYTLGQRVGVNGTPAVFAANGMLIGGYLPPADLLARLDQLQTTRR